MRLDIHPSQGQFQRNNSSVVSAIDLSAEALRLMQSDGFHRDNSGASTNPLRSSGFSDFARLLASEQFVRDYSDPARRSGFGDAVANAFSDPDLARNVFGTHLACMWPRSPAQSCWGTLSSRPLRSAAACCPRPSVHRASRHR